MEPSCDVGNVALKLLPHQPNYSVLPQLCDVRPTLAMSLCDRNLVDPTKLIEWHVRARIFHPHDGSGRSA